MNRMDPADHAPIQDGMVVHVESDFQTLLPKFMTNRKKEVVTTQQLWHAMTNVHAPVLCRFDLRHLFLLLPQQGM